MDRALRPLPFAGDGERGALGEGEDSWPSFSGRPSGYCIVPPSVLPLGPTAHHLQRVRFAGSRDGEFEVDALRRTTRNMLVAKVKNTAMLALLFSVALIPASGGTQNQPQNPPTSETQTKSKVVYVCSCLKTKSCSCMTEAKTEGPCSCGTAGGPPMKAVPPNSAWAKANRRALAK
jgi:hypothetical protein